MKNVGLLSLPMTWNYGGILQQYALQEAIRFCGHETHILCRRQTRNKFMEAAVALKWWAIPEIHNYLRLNEFPLFAVESFKKKFLRNQSPPCFSGASLINYMNKNKINAIVVGSDQVWNKWAAPDLLNYYLDFCENRSDLTRVAYAPSFSKPEWDYDNKEQIRCGELLKKFDAISTREHIGVVHCEKYFNIAAKLVPDPTMLLDSQHYVDIFHGNVEFHSGYKKRIFSYFLDDSLEKKIALRDINRYLDADVFVFAKNLLETKGGSHISKSVENWLYNISSSDFVVTDSFHGVVFSIIFNRPFLCFPNVKRGFDRFSTLDVELGVGDRFVISGRNPIDIIKKDMDWLSINKKRTQWVAAGKAFLADALGER